MSAGGEYVIDHVSAICRECACPLLVAREHFAEAGDDPTWMASNGVEVRWQVKDAGRIALPLPERGRKEPVDGQESCSIDDIPSTIGVWCDRHGAIPVSGALIRSMVVEARRTKKTRTVRVSP